MSPTDKRSRDAVADGSLTGVFFRQILRVGVKQISAAGKIGQPAIGNLLVFMVSRNDDATSAALQSIRDAAARMIQ